MPSSNVHLYLSTQIATLTSALFGYSVGLIGGLLVLPAFLSHFQLSSLSESKLAAAQARIVSLWLVGAFVGVPVGIPLCGRWGRRVCLAGAAALYVVGAALQVTGAGLTWFEMGRLVNGLGVGMGTLVGPMYISEVSTPEKRGMLMSGYQTTLQLCALGGFWCAFAANAIFTDDSDLQWAVPVMIQLIPGVLLLVGTIVTPETPRFLAEKGRWQRATESLAWLRGLPEDHPALIQELYEIREAAEISQAVQARQQTSFFREAVKKPVRRRIGVGVGLMVAQNMVGLNALNYYCPVIFMSAGFTSVSSSLFLTGLFGIIKLISAASFMFIFVRIRGNRFWLKLGSAVCGISMFTLAYLVRQLMSSPASGDAGNSTLTLNGVVSVIMVYIFAFAFGVSLGPISWNVCSEIFPLHLNTKCCAITTCTQWLFQIVIAALTPPLLSSIGWGTYVLYGLCCAISYVWVELCVPETRGVPLGKPMDALFEDDKDRMGKPDDDEALIEEVEDIDEQTALLERVETRERETKRRGSVIAAV